MAFCSMAAIASIRAYTNPDEYELIIIETLVDSKVKIEDFHNNLQLDRARHIIHKEEDRGNSADMNEGAKLATGDYLVFCENDVFVHENWLTDLRYYLDNDLADVIIPNQIYQSWDKMKEYKKQTYEQSISPGIQEQGLMMIRKETFDKTGGWDKRFKKVYGWAAFQTRLRKVTSKIFTTDKVFITHIPGSSYWYSMIYDKENYDKIVHKEAEIIKELK